MRMSLFIIPLALVLFLSSVVAAQTVLKPGSTTFKIPPIGLNPLSPAKDFTGTQQVLGLEGDLYYLNIWWDASYADVSQTTIGVECYLNCQNPDDNIDANCGSLKTVSTNYCSYLGSVGERFCTITNPKYLFTLVNNITCKFYNPASQNILYKPYPNRTFKPVDFQVFTEGGTVVVGKTLIIPVNIRPSGLLMSSYTSNISVSDPEQLNLVLMGNAIGTTDRLKYGQIGITYPKITFLSSQNVNLKLLVTSNTDPTACTANDDCKYLGDAECVDSKCWEKTIIKSSAGKASLPEFGLFGFIQIALLASAAFIFIGRRLPRKK